MITGYKGKISKAFMDGKPLRNVIVGGTPLFLNEGDIFTDPRDGKQYPFKRMPDGKYWMTVNLDYIGYGVYYNNSQTPPFPNAGRLYTPSQAISAAAGLGSGWRLPTFNDCKALFTAVDGPPYSENGGAWFTNAGKILKSKSIWSNPGLDTYGFNAIPVGIYDGSFHGVYEGAHFWTSTNGYGGVYGGGYFRFAFDNKNAVAEIYGNYGEGYKFSIRCVRD